MSEQKLLTFRSGGWVIVLTIVLSVVVVGLTLIPAMRRAGDRPPGDGRDPATYGFDLTTCIVPRGQIAAGQLHRDLVVPLDDPQCMSGSTVSEFNAGRRHKYLLPRDRVIGVEIAGEARAYPLVVLTVREVVNDTLGGRPIAVTYNPLCDSAVVVGRPVDADGAPRAFGVSGLLYNSNLLLYDRGRDGQESLWSQLQRRAIAGPAAGTDLDLVPAEVTHWEQWLTRHPHTTVIQPDPLWLKRYQETSYASYFGSKDLLFPVDPAPPVDGPAAKTQCLIVFTDAERRVYPLPFLAAHADTEGRWRDTLGATSLTFEVGQDPPVARVTSDAQPLAAVQAFWFAWHAMDPGADLAGSG